MQMLIGAVNTTGTVTGGSWLAGSPASDALTAEFADVARSTNALTTSTILIIDHGSAVSLQPFEVPLSNLSSAALVRLTRGTTSGASDVYDSGWLTAWPYTPWGAVNGRKHGVFIVPAAANSARYSKLEIDDTTNPDGYVELKLFSPTQTLLPTINMSYGLQDKIKDLSSKDGATVGAVWGEKRRSLRAVSFVLENLTLAEGGWLHELCRSEGRTDPVLYIPDISDRAWTQKHGFLGTLDEMTDVEYPFFDRRKFAAKMTEMC